MTMTKSESGKLGSIAAAGTIARRTQDTLNAYSKNPNTCTHCKSELEYKKRHNKFCSRSCSASHNNTGVCRNGESRPGYCAQCGEATTNKKYCSHSCRVLNKQKKHIDAFVENGIAWNGLKSYLIKTRGHTCSCCGTSEWMNQPIPLELEHIDGDSQNNYPSNVTLLCPNCHAQTSTYKGKNKGNGRHYRRIRYAEGKSY